MRARLTPQGFPFGTRRPSVDSQYFQTFNSANVELVDIKANPIQAITATGIRPRDATYKLDVIVYATGFDVFTGSMLKPEIVGRGGITLRDKRAAGPLTYLGLGVAGFPNLFILAGPGSPSLLSNVVLSLEQQVDWLVALLAYADGGVVEFTPEAKRDWVAHVNERAQETLYPQTASDHMGVEVAGKPQVFMPYSGGVRGYRRILEKCAAAGYDGFAVAPARHGTRNRDIHA